MSQDLRVVHTAEFVYDGPAVRSYNEARLTPQATRDQIVVHTRLDVSPTPWTQTYLDYHGNAVTAFELLDPHERLTVTATSTVHVQRADPGESRLSWDEMLRLEDRFCEELVCADIVRPPADLVATLRSLAEAAPRPADAVREIGALIHREVHLDPASTLVRVPAAKCWRQRRGVRQDIAHLMAGALRTVGIPARYASGYLHPDAEPVVGESVESAPHAWVEWWDDSWEGYDVTLQAPVGDRHVVLAHGRDYADVRPLSGIFEGGTTEGSSTTVTLTRMS